MFGILRCKDLVPDDATIAVRMTRNKDYGQIQRKSSVGAGLHALVFQIAAARDLPMKRFIDSFFFSA
jgi:hypothetical protein